MADREFCEVCEKTTDDPTRRKAPLYGWNKKGCPLEKPRCWEHWAPDGEQTMAYKKFIEIFRISLDGAHLENADLVAVDLEGANLISAHLERANLYKACLKGATLWLAHLERANLNDANLEGANLGAARLDGAKLDTAKLDGARLARASLREASLKQASMKEILEGWNLDLRGADLFDANLEGSNIWNSDLRGASLRGANLTRTDLRYSDMRNADLSLAKMNEADLREIKQTLYTLSTMFRDALRRGDNRVQITRWDGADGVDRARIGPSAKSYVKWISRVEDHRANNPANAFILRWIWFYGRSPALFAIQIVIWALIFGFAYADHTFPEWFPAPVVDFLSGIDPKLGEVHKGILDGYTSDGFIPYYYSVVTMTSLGFGDVVPLNLAGRVFVVIEAFFGYIYLGLLISVIASGITRFMKGD